MDWLKIVAEDWIPPLITVIVGGLSASIIIPRLQSRYNRQKIIEHKRIELLEEIADCFPLYITNWRRLRQIAEVEAANEGNLPDDVYARKMQFVQSRNDYRDRLFSLLHRSSIYYSDEIQILTREFMMWDEELSVVNLHDLPNIKDWENHESVIMSKMKLEL